MKLLLPFLVFIGNVGLSQQLALTLSSGSAAPGGSISLSLDLEIDGGVNPATLTWTLSYDGQDFETLDLTASPATAAAGKSIQCTYATGSASCMVVSTGASPLSGGLLALATLRVSSLTTNQTSALTLTRVVASSAQNSTLAVTQTGGTVTILQALPPVIYPATVVNAASLMAKPLAPGEIISVFGSGIGPSAGKSTFIAGNGLLSTSVGDTRVFFDGVPAPVLFAGSNQVNVVVPYEVIGKNATHLQLEYRGAQSTEVLFPVADAAVGLFTTDSSGQGLALIVNEDGILNSLTNPARPGSVISLFATGSGQSDPAGVTGAIIASTTLTPLLPVRVLIGALDAGVLFAGAPVGSTNGLLKVTARVPASVDVGNVPIFVIVGPDQSQTGVICVIGEVSLVANSANRQ